MEISPEKSSFQFMIKEYEMLYGKFQMHYEAVEKTINFYFILVGVIMSLSSFLSTAETKIEVFNLNGIQNLLLLIFSILGTLVFFKVIEHRLLIIAYVKSLNLNRKWFQDNSDFSDLSKYLYWKATPDRPDFYKKYRHFYWEAMALSTINSLLTALLLINLTIKTELFLSQYSSIFNVFYLIFFTIILVFPQMYYYKVRAKVEKTNLNKRFTTNEIFS